MSLGPAIVAEFTLPDGEVLRREYPVGPIPVWIAAGPPAWLENPVKAWDHPQDPVTFTGNVVAGFEDEARAALA